MPANAKRNREEEEEEWSTTIPAKFDHDVKCYCGKTGQKIKARNGNFFYSCCDSTRVTDESPEKHKEKAVDGYYKGCWFFCWDNKLSDLQVCKMCSLYMKKEGWIKSTTNEFYSCANNHRVRKPIRSLKTRQD